MMYVTILGLKKPTEEEIQEEQDAAMRTQYVDPIESFPGKIDQLLDALNRVLDLFQSCHHNFLFLLSYM